MSDIEIAVKIFMAILTIRLGYKTFYDFKAGN